MEEFIAVLVLYKLSLSESQTFLSIRRSLKKNNRCLDLVVYDNTPEYNIELAQQSLIDKNINIIYYPDNHNSGVSKAYNTAKDIGKKAGKKWIILLDQDTNFPENAVEKYVEGTKLFPDENLYTPIMLIKDHKIISPSYFIGMRGVSLKHIHTGINSLNNLSVINCGMCISILSFEKNTGYNELIKLDFSDHDFIKRFKKNIGNRFIVLNLNVNHELSTIP
jgi:rhamnosyltransferase